MSFAPSRNLSGLTNESLRDYQHAARTFTDDQFALAPKFKFGYHIVFGLNKSALSDPSLYQIHNNEISLLVKSVDLPSFDIKTETLNQYNRKKIIQYTHTYKPISIIFHDDNLGVINNLWNNYYSYYYADPSASTVAGSYKRNATRNFNHTPTFYGLDNGSTNPFFTYIKMYQLARHEYVCYTLTNPIITSWNHNKLAYSENTPHDNTMQVEYEAVSYNYGFIDIEIEQKPEGFGRGRYDASLSPLQGSRIQGKVNSSFTESSKIKNNAANVLGSALESINSYQNTNNLNSQPTNNIITNTESTPPPNNGISNVVFPQSNNNSANVTANQKTF